MGNRWFTVLEWVKKTEYQGRGTEHTHIAAWVLAHVVLRLLAGNTKTVQVMTCLLHYLFIVFGCEVDIQVGNGRLNYINGYIAKDHDTVDVGLGEYVQRGNTAPWLASYRLLSKSTPCIPGGLAHGVRVGVRSDVLARAAVSAPSRRMPLR